jgi:tetratricopeptide (TPR) repeat protein
MPWFSPSIESVKRRIRRAWISGDTEGMERIAANYAHRRPDEPQAWFLWGNLLFKRGDFQAAEGVLREGIALHPSSDPDLGWLLARAVGGQNRADEAKEILEQQAKLFPNSRLPYLGLLEVAIEAADWAVATRLADETAARTRSGDNSGKYELAVQLLQMPGRRAEAISMLREVVEVAAEPGPSLLLLGAVLESDADPDAGRYLDRARKAWIVPGGFDSALESTRAYVERFMR